MTLSVLRIALCLLLAMASLATAATKSSEESASKIDISNLPPHPRLLLTAKGIEEVKQRIQTCDWAREQWESIKAAADKDLKKDIVLPPRGGNWSHWYACPEHGCALTTGKQIGEWRWEHKCPVGGEILLGDPSKASKDYDGIVITNIHGEWAKSAVDLGLVYQMTGDIRYAQKSRDILLAYAEKYLNYPIHDNNGEPKLGSRVGSQNLNESIWLIRMCQGADLIWDTLTKAQQNEITNKMMLPAAKDVIMPNPHGVHNIQCWRNSAMGLVGFLIGDAGLVNYAINNPGTGFRTQMEKGVSSDGQWWEGAWGYHFYTMSAIWNLTEAARNCGIDLYCPEYKRMFDAPLKFAMPNMHLPAFNDSSEVNLGSGSAIYELAYARYNDAICLELLSKSNRRNDFALLYGVAKLPNPPGAGWQSANYPSTGYAILSKGKGEQATWLGLKYGPHGGGHGHPDKLSFVLCAKGHVMGIDPGTTRYGLPLQKQWHRTTLAHNTLTIDEDSQKPAEGKCIAFGTTNGVDYAVCNAGRISDGVSFTRTAALLDDNLIVFIDQIESTGVHTFDLAYHQAGAWKGLPRGVKWTPPDKPGYMHLKDATSHETGNGISLSVQGPNDSPVVIGLAGGEQTEVITATGVGKSIVDRVPTVIFRSRAKQTTTPWYISMDGKPISIDRLRVVDAGGKPCAGATAVRVTDPGGKVWNMVSNPEKKAVRVLMADGTEWSVGSAFAAR